MEIRFSAVDTAPGSITNTIHVRVRRKPRDSSTYRYQVHPITTPMPKNSAFTAQLRALAPGNIFPSISTHTLSRSREDIQPYTTFRNSTLVICWFTFLMLWYAIRHNIRKNSTFNSTWMAMDIPFSPCMKNVCLRKRKKTFRRRRASSRGKEK